jgi:hypothetical protein
MCDVNKVDEIVPTDMSVNEMMAVAWETAKSENT